MTRHFTTHRSPLLALPLLLALACGTTRTGPGELEDFSGLLLEPAPTPVPSEGPWRPVLSDPLTVERVTGGEFRTASFGPARWLEDGTGYTTLEPAAAGGGREIVRYDPGSGERRVLISSASLVPADAEEPLEVADYHWSDDGSKLLIFTNTRRVWRYHTRGDYWVLDLKSGALKKLGGQAPEATLMFAKFSPDGARVAYVREHDVYVEDLTVGTITALTDDGSETLINGTFDWVYEEELSLRDGFRWSPDGERIAYWQLDASGVGEFYMIDNTSGLYSKIVPVQYPKVGTTNSAGRIGVVDARGGETRWFAVPGDPRNHYIARMEWAESSKEVVIQHLNRLQNTNEVMLGDADTGEVRAILVDRDEAWLDVVDDLVWLDGGARFTWVSERDGWRHVYLVSRDGKQVELVTPGAFDVVSVAHIDTRGGWLYYIAAPEQPTRRFLFRSRLDGSGEPERLTPAGLGGTSGYQISEDARFAFHTHSAFGVPPTISLVSLPEHRTLRTFVDNAELKQKLASLDRGEREFFRVDVGDGIELDGWCLKPPGFDPERRWPVIFHVYSEPWAQTVLDQWLGRNFLWHWMLSQQGWVVISVDNRGTPAPRGREWRKCVYGKIGVISSHDQAAAATGLMERHDWIDAERIAIWGWSGGGSMSLNAIFRHPEIYGTAVSVAPVPDQRLYDTIYQERYMGLPDQNPDGFREGSPITHAEQLEGNLLLVHGTADDNVHIQGSELLVNELIRHGKRFTYMAYPGRSHGIYEGEGTTRHLYDMMTEYLRRNSPPGPRPLRAE